MLCESIPNWTTTSLTEPIDVNAEAPAATDSLFRFLMTDAQTIGMVGWVGTLVGIVSLVVTIAGFWIAIVQLKRVKQSAEAAQMAVRQMTRVVKKSEQNASLTHALSQLRIARAYLSNNPGAAGAYLDNSCTALMEARELTSLQSDQEVIMIHLSRLQKIEGELRLLSVNSISPTKMRAYGVDIRKASSDIEIITARLRYSFDTSNLAQ